MTYRPKPKGTALTAAELRVAALIAQDLADKTIADRLGCAQKTVEVHAQNIRDRLGLRSKIGIAVWWVTVGQHLPKPQAEPALPVQRSPRVYVRMSDYIAARGLG
jgi:DNA-binding CsgD family transcriptional regulator